MSTQTSPVNGNQSFTHVTNQAEQLPHVNVSDANIGTLNANLVRANVVVPINGVIPGTSTVFAGKQLRAVVGNIPTNTAAATATWLNKAYGAPSSNALTDILLLPPGALIVGAFLQDVNDTYAGGVTDLGTAAATGVAPVASTNIFSNATQANVRLGVSVGQLAPSALGGTGVATGSYLSVSTVGNTGVCITPTDIAVSSGVSCVIYYLL